MIAFYANKDATWPSRTPRELGGATGGTYVVLERDEDVDAHCARARAAGANIISEPTNPDYGGRNYGAADPNQASSEPLERSTASLR